LTHCFRVIVIRDGNIFVAQTAGVDVSAQGQTSQQAVDRLHIALAAELEFSRSTSKPVPAASELYKILYETEIVQKRELTI